MTSRLVVVLALLPSSLAASPSSLTEAVTVPYGFFSDALVTKEWSPLEPDVETHKFYVKGLGVVRDVAVRGQTEESVLIKVQH